MTEVSLTFLGGLEQTSCSSGSYMFFLLSPTMTPEPKVQELCLYMY